MIFRLQLGEKFVFATNFFGFTKSVVSVSGLFGCNVFHFFGSKIGFDIFLFFSFIVGLSIRVLVPAILQWPMCWCAH